MRALALLGDGVAYCIIALIWLVARTLAPWRMGRLLRTVSLPRMQEHRMRTSMTVLGVALGVAVLVAVVTLNHSIIVGATATLDELAGRADLQVHGGSSGTSETVLDEVRSVAGVFKLTPVCQQVVNLRKSSGERERVLLLGIDLLGKEDAYFRSYASKELTEIRRDPLEFLNSSTNIILSRPLARRLGVKLHDKLRMSTGTGVQEFDVWGFIDDDGVGRAFGGSVAVMYYPAMQVAFGRGRNIDRIDVAVAPGADAGAVQAALLKRLGPSFSVDRPTLRGDRLSKMLTAMRAGLTMASIVALVAGTFLVFNTAAISVVQRKRELGILRALGIARGQLRQLLTLEGILLGIAGSVLGTVIGVLLSRTMLRVTTRAVSELYLEQPAGQVQLDPWLMLAAFVLGSAGSGLAARFATHRASGIRPVDALNNAVVPSVLATARGVSRADVVGMGLFIVSVGLLFLPSVGGIPVSAMAACVLLVLAVQALLPRVVQLSHWLLSRMRLSRLGAATALAVQNVPRDLGRSAGMASGLMAGVSLTVSVAVFIASFISSVHSWSGQVLPGDLFVTSGNALSGLSSRNVPMADSLRPELLKIPGVEKVRSIRLAEMQYQGATIKLAVSEFRTLLQTGDMTTLEGDRKQLLQAVEGGAVVVSENFSRTFHVHFGDHVQLATASGTRSFLVSGVVLDYSSDIGAVLMDRATYLREWADDRVDTYELHLAPGANAQEVRRIIDGRLAEKHDLFVLTNGEFRRVADKAADQIFGLLRALEIITLLVAALGLTTTVLANVMDRVREIGMLRALGMYRGQVGWMIVIETMVIGAIGTLAGILLGAALGYISLTRVTSVLVGWYLPFKLPLVPMLQLALVTLLISVAAGFIPARRAAGLVVRNALDRE